MIEYSAEPVIVCIIIHQPVETGPVMGLDSLQ